MAQKIRINIEAGLGFAADTAANEFPKGNHTARRTQTQQNRKEGSIHPEDAGSADITQDFYCRSAKPSQVG